MWVLLRDVFVLTRVSCDSVTRLTLGMYLRNHFSDQEFKANSFVGKALPFPMMDGVCSPCVVPLKDCGKCTWPHMQGMPRLLRSIDVVCPHESQVQCFPTLSLDHGLYARALDNFRGEERRDFIERLMETDEGTIINTSVSHYPRPPHFPVSASCTTS